MVAATAALRVDAAKVQLPTVLQWHMGDLGVDMPAQLATLLPLLPAGMAAELGALLAADLEASAPPAERLLLRGLSANSRTGSVRG